MRTSALALAIALALALPMLPTARAASTWSIAETITLHDATLATREWKVTYDVKVYSNKWTLAKPLGTTFTGAHGAAGEPLLASEKDGQVTITSDGPTFFADFDEKPTPMGAFVLLHGGPSAAADSPTSTKVVLPSGWTMPGWSGGDGVVAPKDQTWTGTGPFYVEALALPPGAGDAGPDARGKAGDVLRDADATIRADGAALNVTVIYDSDLYSEAWSLPLPDDLRLVDVSAPLPNVTFAVRDGAIQVRAPYPAQHHLGPRAFTLHYAADVTTFGGDYRRVNLSVPGGPKDALTLRVSFADDLEWVGARINSVNAAKAESYHATGAATMSIAFLPPVTGDRARVTVGPFVVQAPKALEASARDAARQAQEELPLAADYARDHVDDAPIHIVYTAAPIFAWEEGVYLGLDATSIRASDLREDGTANLTAVRTLVHEAGHALVDRQRNGVLLDDSFLNEGLSRLAEAHIELRHPNEIVTCTTSGTSQQCSRTSSRVDAGELRAFLASGRPFDVGWNASSASDAARGFDYDYSGYVLLHYERAAPRGALAKTLDALRDVLLPTGDQIVKALLDQAPGMTQDDLLYPGKADAASLSDAAFAAKLADLVAPPFPDSGSGALGGVKVPGPGVPLLVLAAALVAALRRTKASR